MKGRKAMNRSMTGSEQAVETHGKAAEGQHTLPP